MSPSDEPSVTVLRRADSSDPIDSRRLRRSLDDGTIARVLPGVFCHGDAWQGLTPQDRHRTRVLETVRRLKEPAVLSHHAAAALWRIDILGDWPTRVDVIGERANGGRSSSWVRRHSTGLSDVEAVPFGRHRVTTPAQTVLDLARVLPFVDAVSAMDQALWEQRPNGALTTREHVDELAARAAPHRGHVRAARVIAFSTHLAANVRESQSRVVLMRLGFPVPRLQERRVLRSGRLVYGDFYFPEHDHWGELDGHGKYRDQRMTGGRDAAAVVIEEKRRENEIRREVRGFSRWEPRDVDSPRRLYDILTRDGLPSALPRP